VQVLALGVAHGFARLRYVVTSIAASVTALLSVHLSDPTETIPVIARLADTMVGAALAHLFSHVLPRWEFNEAPRLAARLQADIVAFATTALDLNASDQDYRLARKRIIEAIAALSDSAGRMGGEPQGVRRGLNELIEMLISGYLLAAHISSTRFTMRGRRSETGYEATAAHLAATREWLIGLLSGAQATADLRGPALVVGPPNEALGGEFTRLRRAALTLLTTASIYRQAAAVG
jgi:uncharacterized membrane protein YccC